MLKLITSAPYNKLNFCLIATTFLKMCKKNHIFDHIPGIFCIFPALHALDACTSIRSTEEGLTSSKCVFGFKILIIEKLCMWQLRTQHLQSCLNCLHADSCTVIPYQSNSAQWCKCVNQWEAAILICVQSHQNDAHGGILHHTYLYSFYLCPLSRELRNNKAWIFMNGVAYILMQSF